MEYRGGIINVVDSAYDLISWAADLILHMVSGPLVLFFGELRWSRHRHASKEFITHGLRVRRLWIQGLESKFVISRDGCA